MGMGNRRHVKDENRHHTSSIAESSAKIQSVVHPVAPFEEPRPGVSRLFDKHRGISGRVAENMSDEQTPGGTQDQKGNTFRLSRRSAVKRASTRGKRNLPERRDSKMTSNHSPVEASYDILADRSTPDGSPTLRRFSFDTVSDHPLFDLADMQAAIGCSSESRSELGHVSYTTLLKARDTASPSLISRDAGRKMTNVPQICSSNNDRRLDEAREERSWEKTGIEKVRTERRPTPTTFNEILGRKRIPTALL